MAFQFGDTPLGLIPSGTPASAVPLVNWDTQDASTLQAALAAAGGTVREQLHNVDGSKVVANVEDPSGNIIGIQQRGKA